MSEAPTPCRARGRHSKHIFFCGSHPPPKKKHTNTPKRMRVSDEDAETCP